jgi:Na+-transporting methylmalonyl-CoA/oxaloacetate decarboxylase gamma subunit
MTTALWITLIGMGMVFAVIMLLWGVMVLLVKVTSSQKRSPEETRITQEEPVQPVVDEPSVVFQKRAASAAAAAVAVAVAMNIEMGLPKNGGQAVKPDSISPWQAAHRAARANREGIGQKPGGKR